MRGRAPCPSRPGGQIVERALAQRLACGGDLDADEAVVVVVEQHHAGRHLLALRHGTVGPGDRLNKLDSFSQRGVTALTTGLITLGPMQAKAMRMLEVSCRKCERRGRLSIARLMPSTDMSGAGAGGALRACGRGGRLTAA